MASIDTTGIDITKPEAGEATTQSVRDNTSAIKDALDSLSSTDANKGASTIGLEDSAGDWDAGDVEALAGEIADKLNGTSYIEAADIGDPGTETGGIDVNGTIYQTRLRINDIGGSYAAQFVIHRHSTTLQPLLLGARSNSNDSTHGVVTSGQALFSILASGWTGTHYDLFGESKFTVGTGTVSATSSPGKWTLSLAQDGSNTLADVIVADSDKSVDFAGPINAAGLSVDANSTGNVSRYAMTTASGGTGVEDGANTWANIADLKISATGYRSLTLTLSIESAFQSGNTAHALVRLRLFQNPAISTLSKIEVLSCDVSGLTNRSFKVTGPNTGPNDTLKLWVNKKTNYNRLAVTEISRSGESDLYVDYKDNAAWQSAVPSDTVNVVSDWANIDSYVPVVTASAGSITSYSVGVADFQIINGMAHVMLSVNLIDVGTATGTCLITLPKAIRSGFGIGQAFGRAEVVGGEMLQGRVVGSSLSVWHYDNTTPFVTSAVLNLVVIYPV